MTQVMKRKRKGDHNDIHWMSSTQTWTLFDHFPQNMICYLLLTRQNAIVYIFCNDNSKNGELIENNLIILKWKIIKLI